MFLILILLIFLLADSRSEGNRRTLLESRVSKFIFGFLLVLFIIPHLFYITGLFWPGFAWSRMPLMMGSGLISGRSLGSCFF